MAQSVVNFTIHSRAPRWTENCKYIFTVSPPRCRAWPTLNFTDQHQQLTNEILGWENSRHFATPPLISPRNDVWETSAEIPYWWSVTTQIFGLCFWLVEVRHDQSEVKPRSGKQGVISMEFLRLFLRRHYARKPVVASRNVGCFLKLIKFISNTSKKQ